MQLQNNVKLNPDLKIECRNIAISDKNEDLVLYARSKYGESSSGIMPRIRDNLNQYKAQGMTLENFIKSERVNKVDFIKMDIEGGEFIVLPAMAETLQKLNFPTLYISFHYDNLREHQYYLNLNLKFLSLVLMKLETWFKFDLFKKKNKILILNSIEKLNQYEFIYSDNGTEIIFKELITNPLIIKNHNLVFTNKRWTKN